MASKSLLPIALPMLALILLSLVVCSQGAIYIDLDKTAGVNEWNKDCGSTSCADRAGSCSLPSTAINLLGSGECLIIIFSSSGEPRTLSTTVWTAGLSQLATIRLEGDITVQSSTLFTTSEQFTIMGYDEGAEQPKMRKIGGNMQFQVRSPRGSFKLDSLEFVDNSTVTLLADNGLLPTVNLLNASNLLLTQTSPTDTLQTSKFIFSPPGNRAQFDCQSCRFNFSSSVNWYPFRVTIATSMTFSNTSALVDVVALTDGSTPIDLTIENNSNFTCDVGSLISSSQMSDAKIRVTSQSILTNIRVRSRFFSSHAPISAAPSSSHWQLYVDDAIVSGWKIYFANIIFSSQSSELGDGSLSPIIQNCGIHLGDLGTEDFVLVRSGVAKIIFDYGASPSLPINATYQGSQFSPHFAFFDNTNITIRPSSSLILQTASTHLASNYPWLPTTAFFINNTVTVVAQGGSTDCEFIIAPTVTLGPNTLFSVDSCGLTLRSGTIASNTSMIRSINPATQLVLGPSTAGWPKFDGHFELGYFSLLTLDMISSNSLPSTSGDVAFIRPNTNARSLRISSKPDRLRIVYPSGISPPLQGHRYLLYELDSYFLLPDGELSLISPPQDLYQFNITYEPFQVQQRTKVWASNQIFNCELSAGASSSGVCVTNSSVSQPILLLPNSDVVIINGNLTTGTITFSGLTSVQVTGCIASNLSTINIELTEEDVKLIESKSGKKLTLALLSQGSSCPNQANLAGLKLNTKIKAKA